jgi:hypothetical protein
VSRENVVEELKRYAPASLKVTLTDGTEKPVAVPKAGNRWARTAQVLAAMHWTQIECIDKDGRVCGLVEDDDDAPDLEEGDEPSVDLAMAKVLAGVQQSTMKECRQMFDAVLRGTEQMLSAVTDAMKVITTTYQQAMQVQAANSVVEAQGGGSPEMMQMFQAAMMLMNQPKQIPTKKEG